MLSTPQAWAMPTAIVILTQIVTWWYSYVQREVPEPYLDEFFHIPQAQKYCKGDYSWDPKITTPPGLYLISKLEKPLLGCETSNLRILNSQALVFIFLLSYGILQACNNRKKRATTAGESPDPVDNQKRVHDIHSAFNIALFPPLFFFSALYYTDVMSTMIVLVSYWAYLGKTKARDEVTTIFIGVLALFFRQTNIFWVAIFPAGLAVVDVLKKSAEHNANPGKGNSQAILRESWSKGTVYDCPVQDAGPQDYILFVVSIIISAVRRPLPVFRAILPFASLLVLFAGFVMWNGSVVLGDKSAHTATIHLPQMLYIWPYIAFFSAPILLGPLMRPVMALLPARFRTICRDSLNVHAGYMLPNLLFFVMFVATGLIVVHFNTIVHPYTLADNRHYVFYVFRIFRLYPATKYLGVPVYYVCAWLTIQSLASTSTGEEGAERKCAGRPTNDETEPQPCQVSFIIIWLATTALSLITAPLVEPRYFIIPWIIWRLHVPYSSASFSKNRSTSKASYDLRLVLETIWLLAIDAAVCYTFLYRTFTWPSEPGNLQRFIW